MSDIRFYRIRFKTADDARRTFDSMQADGDFSFTAVRPELAVLENLHYTGLDYGELDEEAKEIRFGTNYFDIPYCFLQDIADKAQTVFKCGAVLFSPRRSEMETIKENPSVSEVLSDYLWSIDRLYWEVSFNPPEKLYNIIPMESLYHSSRDILKKWLSAVEKNHLLLKHEFYMRSVKFHQYLPEKEAAINWIVSSTKEFKNSLKAKRAEHKIPLEYYYLLWGFCHRTLRTLFCYKRIIRKYDKSVVR